VGYLEQTETERR